MKTQHTAKSDSKTVAFLKRAAADKAAFKESVANGTVAKYMKENGAKYSNPLTP